MDPISAIGIAAAVVQFLDFGGRVVASAVDSYRAATGKETANTSTKAMALDLESLYADVEKRSTRLSTAPQPGGAEEVFLRTSLECRDVAVKLRAIISGLQRPVDDEPEASRRGFRKLRFLTSSSKMRVTASVALKSFIASGDLAKLKEKMLQLREQASAAAVVQLWLVQDVRLQHGDMSTQSYTV
jgi:hypothetical protein